ncbi:hypothetical protein UFOVP1009_44 [uncultured Caudovirales phage]|uniref:Uncharacterized protein n=1 Tax=uncultured Caudovirales phage TaxID=2100421 RepID=A0A6J5QES7_9CAUD|nr:hypothetical protein UFOVP1009_44 [uncultured Caudovirales phage]
MESLEDTIMDIFEISLLSISFPLILIGLICSIYGANKTTMLTGAFLTIYPSVVFIYLILNWVVRK